METHLDHGERGVRPVGGGGLVLRGDAVQLVFVQRLDETHAGPDGHLELVHLRCEVQVLSLRRDKYV